jgi:ribonuclease P protein component
VRLGVVVSRKVGKAVVRNRVRRRLREAMLALLRADAAGRAGAPAWPPSFDLLVLTRPSAAEADYHELSRALATAIDRALSPSGRGGGRTGSAHDASAAPALAGAA